MYAQVCTHLDITYIVGILGRYLSNPGMDHWKAVKRVMRYLQRIKDYMLTYRRSDQLEIIDYFDSDFVGCQDNQKSTSDYIYLLAGGVISWNNAKQTLIASSTMTIEFIACYEAFNHGIWLQNFVTGLRIVDGIERPLRYFVIISQQYYIPITTRAQRSQSILTSSSQLLKREFRVVRCLQNI